MAVIATDMVFKIFSNNDEDGGVGLTEVSIFIGLAVSNILTQNTITFIATNSRML
jgi:hypothetical protein